MKTLILLGLAVAFVLALIQGQHKMIYYPRSYPAGFKLPDGVIDLVYTTSQESQTAYYWPPAAGDDTPPSSLWLMFAGNASLALDWADFLDDFPDQEAGFLLVDYPGYGKCQGRASPESILESTENALVALVDWFGAKSPDFAEKSINVMGHSLGAAVALLYASRHQAGKIVLLSPFTSLKDMARQVVGSPLNQAMIQEYDNRARLREVLGRQIVPETTIIHGVLDEVIPVEMGRELSGISAAISFQEIPGAGHNNILSVAEREVFVAMADSVSGPESFEE